MTDREDSGRLLDVEGEAAVIGATGEAVQRLSAVHGQQSRGPGWHGRMCIRNARSISVGIRPASVSLRTALGDS